MVELNSKLSMITLAIAIAMQFLTTLADEVVEPFHCVCGEKLIDTRITAGKDTKEHEFPWHAYVRRKGKDPCGGTLINNQYVITSAGCLENLTASDIDVNLGSHKNPTNDEWAPFLPVTGIIMHHKFNGRNPLNFNMGLIKLQKPIEFTNNVRLACLPDIGKDYVGQKVTVVGWGWTSTPSGPSSTVLQKLDAQINTQDDCKFDNLMLITSFCTGIGRPQNETICRGDQGGGLFVPYRDKWQLIGIAITRDANIISGEMDLTTCTPPDRYIRIDLFYDWIFKNTAGSKYCARI